MIQHNKYLFNCGRSWMRRNLHKKNKQKKKKDLTLETETRSQLQAGDKKNLPAFLSVRIQT